MAQAKATPSPVLQEQIRHFRRLTNAEQQFVRQLIEAFATVQKIRSSLAEWHIGSLGSES